MKKGNMRTHISEALLNSIAINYEKYDYEKYDDPNDRNGINFVCWKRGGSTNRFPNAVRFAAESKINRQKRRAENGGAGNGKQTCRGGADGDAVSVA